jgi:Protein of unknown function (DUF2817)
MANFFQTISILIATALAVFLGYHFRSIEQSKTNKGVRDIDCGVQFQLTDINADCFFKQDYFAARQLFLKSAEEAGAELLFLPVTEELGTDIAILRGTTLSKRFLIHLSGIHGVEGYAGSAVQSAALQYFGHLSQTKKPVKEDGSAEVPSDAYPTIVFVHAMNPYGFANNRRVNEDNVDLNRNFLTEEEFKKVQARSPNYAGYMDLDTLINPKSQVSNNIAVNDAFNIFRTLLALGRYGLLHLKKALVSGNYHKKNGVGFGGFAMSQSAKNLIGLVQGDVLSIQDAEQVVLVDVHTGLGPTGVDTIFTNPPEALEHFPTEKVTVEGSKKESVTGGIHAALDAKRMKEDDAMSGDVGQTISGFCDTYLSQGLDKEKVVCLVQEFGTVSPVVVGMTMIAENYAHHYGSAEEKELYKKRYRDCFYVDTESWRRSVLRRGVSIIRQAVVLLGSTSDDLPEPTFLS